MIPTDSSELLIPVEEIDWIEADDYYVCVHTNDKSDTYCAKLWNRLRDGSTASTLRVYTGRQSCGWIGCEKCVLPRKVMN